MSLGPRRMAQPDFRRSSGFSSLRPSLHRVLAYILFMMVISHMGGRVVKVGIYMNPPKVYWEEGGEPSGIFVDILDHIAAAEGWQVEYHKDTWENCLSLLQDGSVDLMPDVAYNSERDKVMDFHQNPVLYSWTQIYVKRGIALNSLLDLEGLRLAVLRNSVQAKLLQGLFSTPADSSRMVFASSFDEVLALVRDGEADAAATNFYFGRMNARKYGLEETDILLEPSTLFFAAKQGYFGDILNAIDNHLNQLKSIPDSYYYQVLNKYVFSSNKYSLPRWSILLALSLIFALLISILIGNIFRKQVRKRTAELHKANLEMEKRIEQRTEELAMAMHKAQVADMLKSAFLATMSHELRTPLNSVIGFTGILLKEMPGKINEEQSKMLSIIQGSARHLLSLINDVLDISKIEAGQLDLHYSNVNLYSLLENAIQLVGVQAAAKGLNLVFKPGSEPGDITVDERRFEQVILNLLSNAIKFCDEGEVSLSYIVKDKQLYLMVKDTGIGIPPEKQSKLFQPFVQVDMGINRKYEGTGLGLFISRRIMNLMGGDITLESEVNKGSLFTVILPLKNGGIQCKQQSSS